MQVIVTSFSFFSSGQDLGLLFSFFTNPLADRLLLFLSCNAVPIITLSCFQVLSVNFFSLVLCVMNKFPMSLTQKSCYCCLHFNQCQIYRTLPAGYLEVGESTAEGASRETLEEACADVEIISPFAQLDIPLIGQVSENWHSQSLSYALLCTLLS